jgi:CLIP-associating protein 1/2
MLGLLRASLSRYISSQPSGQNGNGNGNGNGHGEAAHSKAQASGYLFGLNGMGMCILRLPGPVIEVEAPKLASIVNDVSRSYSSGIKLIVGYI